MGVRITTVDNDGTKSRPLGMGEFGYDNHTDKGRVYVGTAAGEDIPLAQLQEIVPKAEIAPLLRADKYLASQNVVNMLYSNGDLVKIRYNNDTDVDYEVLEYTNGDLTSIKHYVDSVLKGTTTLTYTNGSLISAVFVGV